MDKIEQKRQFIIQCMYWGIWILLGIFAIRYAQQELEHYTKGGCVA